MTKTTNLSRRRLLASSMPALATAAALAPAAATALCRLPAEGDDPIFPAIEAHKQAVADWQALDDDSDEVNTEYCKRANLAFWRVFETAPTSLAGLVALFDHFVEPQWQDGGELTVIQWAVEGWGLGNSHGATSTQWATLMVAALKAIAEPYKDQGNS
jgi:hypothetical protein